MERIIIEKLPSVENEEQKRHLVRYVNFINSRPEQKLYQRGFATHHIYPKSIAKKNNIEDFDGDWNLIELTHREHFIAHMILFYCGYSEMISAFWYMINNYGNITSRFYEKIRIKYIDFKSKDNSERFWINNDFDEKFVKQEDMYLFKNYKGGRLKKEEYSKRYDYDKVWIFKDNSEFLCNKNIVDDFIKVGYLLGRAEFSKERCEKMSNSKKGMIKIYKDNKQKTIYKISARKMLGL